MNILQKPRLPIDEEIAYFDYEGKKLVAWRGDYAANVLKLGQSTILRPYREYETPKDWEQANIGHKFYNADGFLIGIVDGMICNKKGEALHIYLNEHNQEIEEPSSELLAHPENTLEKMLHPVTLPLLCYRNRKTVDMASYALFPEPEIMGIEGFDQLTSSLEVENSALHNFIPKCIIMRLLQEEGLPPPIEEPTPQAPQPAQEQGPAQGEAEGKTATHTPPQLQAQLSLKDSAKAIIEESDRLRNHPATKIISDALYIFWETHWNNVDVSNDDLINRETLQLKYSCDISRKITKARNYIETKMPHVQPLPIPEHRKSRNAK